jgi:hypothetical protein
VLQLLSQSHMQHVAVVQGFFMQRFDRCYCCTSRSGLPCLLRRLRTDALTCCCNRCPAATSQTKLNTRELTEMRTG